MNKEDKIKQQAMEQIRDWWYALIDDGYHLPEIKRVKIEKIVKEALKQQREEIEKELKEKMKASWDSHVGTEKYSWDLGNALSVIEALNPIK